MGPHWGILLPAVSHHVSLPPLPVPQMQAAIDESRMGARGVPHVWRAQCGAHRLSFLWRCDPRRRDGLPPMRLVV